MKNRLFQLAFPAQNYLSKKAPHYLKNITIKLQRNNNLVTTPFQSSSFFPLPHTVKV